MYRKYSRIIFPSVLIVLFPLVLSSAQDVVRVERVIDGDTLCLTNGEKVRLIGIVAPESKPNPRTEEQGEREGKGDRGSHLQISIKKNDDRLS